METMTRPDLSGASTTHRTRPDRRPGRRMPDAVRRETVRA